MRPLKIVNKTTNVKEFARTANGNENEIEALMNE